MSWVKQTDDGGFSEYDAIDTHEFTYRDTLGAGDDEIMGFMKVGENETARVVEVERVRIENPIYGETDMAGWYSHGEPEIKGMEGKLDSNDEVTWQYEFSSHRLDDEDGPEYTTNPDGIAYFDEWSDVNPDIIAIRLENNTDQDFQNLFVRVVVISDTSNPDEQ